MRNPLTLIVLGIVSCLLLLELILRVLPTSTYTDTGYHIDPYIITYRPRHQFTTSFGWDFQHPFHHRANNLGFLSSRDFTPNPDAIALIGDSFVDASMLPPGDRIGEQLQRAIPNRPIYAMGGPGSNLLDYAERIRYAADHLNITDFVIILERGDIKQSLCGSGNIHAECLDAATLQPRLELMPAPSHAKLILRHSVLLQYLLGHLRVDPQARLKRALQATPQVTDRPTKSDVWSGLDEPSIDKVISTFFQRISAYRKGHLLMVFDSDRTALNAGHIEPDPRRQLVFQRCRNFGATVIDTETDFQRYVSSTGRHLEVSPLDKHWNGAATKIIADLIAGRLIKQR